MPAEWIPDLAARCRRRGVEFLSSPFDARAVDELVAHVPAFKVASSTLSHHPLLREIAATDKPVIASTGAHELAEVREALEVLRDAGATDVALLHCVSSYPTPLDDVNVRAVARLALDSLLVKVMRSAVVRRGLVTMGAQRVPLPQQPEAVRVVTVAALHAVPVHLALYERTPHEHLVENLPVGVIQALVEQCRNEMLQEPGLAVIVIRDLAAPRMARSAHVDVLAVVDPAALDLQAVVVDERPLLRIHFRPGHVA